MAKTNWNRTLAEVLKHETQPLKLTSEKTGNDYIAEVVPIITAFSIGTSEEVDGKYKYPIVDTANELEYTIKAPNKIDVKFGTLLQFQNVRGGATPNGIGWYAADSVTVVQRNA